MTALGSAAVVIHRLGLPEAQYRKVLDFMLGVSGGVMTAASYWSLLAPALEPCLGCEAALLFTPGGRRLYIGERPPERVTRHLAVDGPVLREAGRMAALEEAEASFSAVEAAYAPHSSSLESICTSDVLAS